MKKNFLKRFQIMKPKYLFMNENTLTLIEKDWSVLMRIFLMIFLFKEV